MSETTVKTSPVTSIKNHVIRNKTRYLGAVAVTSVAANVVMFRGVKAHNEFLKENGLFDQFYAIVPTEA